MKRIAFLLIAVATVAGVVVSRSPASGQTDGEAAPIYGVKIPPGYRDWRMISLAHVGEPVNDLRVKLGNDIAIKAYREGKPFPDGAIIADPGLPLPDPNRSASPHSASCGAGRLLFRPRSDPEFGQRCGTGRLAGSFRVLLRLLPVRPCDGQKPVYVQ